MESREGEPLEDMSATPPDVVYVIGSSEQWHDYYNYYIIFIMIYDTQMLIEAAG